MKIIAGEMDPTSGRVILEPGKRMSVLNQNHNMFDDHTVLDTILMGNKVLHAVKTEMDALYLDYKDENADRIGELQLQFDEMNGWNAESDAGSMLSNLGISAELHYNLMGDLEGKMKVRVLLAQALFGNPDVLIMDEPTNDLDFETISWLENFLANYENTVLVVEHEELIIENADHIIDVGPFAGVHGGKITFKEFGPKVMGEGWVSHHGKHKVEGARGVVEPANAKHPILRSVKDVFGPSDVYGINALTSKDTILLRGQVTENLNPNSKPVANKNKPMQPLAWLHTYVSPNASKGTTFCTTMGASVDLVSEDLRRLIVNATYHLCGLEVPQKADAAYVDPFYPSFYGYTKNQKNYWIER